MASAATRGLCQGQSAPWKPAPPRPLEGHCLCGERQPPGAPGKAVRTAMDGLPKHVPFMLRAVGRPPPGVRPGSAASELEFWLGKNSEPRLKLREKLI